MKTEKEKIAAGTDRKDRDTGINIEPIFIDYIPEHPDELDPIEIEFYKDNCNALLNMGALTLESVNNVLYYAPWYLAWHRASKKMRDGEYYQTAKTGWEQIAPVISLCEKATKMLQSFASSHGLTPVNKSKVKVLPPKKVNELDNL